MGRHQTNHRLVKINRTYTIEETARVLGAHRNTVRRWIEAGLRTIDGNRPTLIQGRDLVTFLQARRTANKRTCKPGEMYCFRCRAPKFPLGAMADYEPFTDKIANLKGICPDCDTIMNRRISIARVAQVKGKLEITFPQEARLLTEICHPSLNSDFKREGSTHAGAPCQE